MPSNASASPGARSLNHINASITTGAKEENQRMTGSEGSNGSRADTAAMALVNKILAVGVNGLGPYKSAAEMADEVRCTHPDADVAVARLIAIHRRWVGSTGFATGVGGLATLPVTLPTDITTFYMLSARMSASIAVLRGYDVTSEEVQSAVLISLLGAGAAGVVGKVGVEIGTKTAVAGLKKLPGQVLIEINKKVGYRLLTKFGTKGSINLVKAVPIVGGGVGAGVNVVAINQIARYSKRTFIALEPTLPNSDA